MAAFRFFVEFFLFFLVICSGYTVLTFQDDPESSVLEGKKLYEEYNNKVQTYGDCWQKAVSDLHASCRMLTEESQSRLALSFANCFLEKSGSQTCFCPIDKPISDCLKSVDERIFSTYREFFTHTKSICYFLQQREWQKITEHTIVKLSENSERVSRQLEESARSQNEMLGLQQAALQKQQQLINTSEQGIQNLNSELERSRSNAKTIFEEFKTTTEEQRFLMFSVFEQIKKLETLVLGKFADFYTFIYYFLAIILSYLLTSSHRTADARIWLMLLFSSNAVLEKFVSSYSLIEEAESSILLSSNGPVLNRMWICRNVCCIIAIVILLWVFLRYKDYNMINNRLLIEIQKQNAEMQEFIKSLSSTSSVCASGIAVANSVVPHSTATIFKPASQYMSEESCQRIDMKQENSSLDPLHSTPCESGKSAAVAKKPQRKKKEVPFSPITDFDNSHGNPPPGDETLHRRYNLRDRSRLSSPRNTSAYVSLAAEISEKNREEIKRKLKRK